MRETARENAIQDGTETAIYQDQKQIVRQLGAHLTESFIGQVLGAGGVGGAIFNVPFEPALIDVHEATGPTMSRLVRGGGLAADVAVDLIAGGVNATPPVVTQVGPGDWTVTLDTAEAPDGDTATVIISGVRNAGGSL